MKAITFTLIISVIICFGGICANSSFSYEFKKSETSNCHKTHHLKANTNQLIKFPIYPTDKKKHKDSTCCYDSLLNSTQNFKTDHTDFLIVTSDFIPANDTNKTNSYLTNPEIRHRDPPHIFIQYSTLLL